MGFLLLKHEPVEYLDQAQFPQVLHSVAESADARQDEPGGRGKRIGLIADQRRKAEPFDRPRHGTQIAQPVVYDGDPVVHSIDRPVHHITILVRYFSATCGHVPWPPQRMIPGERATGLIPQGLRGSRLDRLLRPGAEGGLERSLPARPWQRRPMTIWRRSSGAPAKWLPVARDQPPGRSTPSICLRP